MLASGISLGLYFFRDEDQLFLSTAGAGQLFSNCDVCDLAKRLERVLAAMTADPARPLSSVGLLDELEHARLEEWGNRAVLTAPASTPESVPVLFDAQVARTPEAVAISCEGRSLTYRELEKAANRLAHLLAEQGSGPGQCVALLFYRSAEAIIAILAVDRGCLSADRPDGARCAAAVRGSRCRADCRGHHRRPGRAAGRVRGGGH